MNLIRIEGVLPKVLDRDLPPELQYIKEREIYGAYQCSNCGHIEEELPSNDVCPECREVGDFSEVEVLEDLTEVEYESV